MESCKKLWEDVKSYGKRKAVKGYGKRKAVKSYGKRESQGKVGNCSLDAIKIDTRVSFCFCFSDDSGNHCTVCCLSEGVNTGLHPFALV